MTAEDVCIVLVLILIRVNFAKTFLPILFFLHFCLGIEL